MDPLIKFSPTIQVNGLYVLASLNAYDEPKKSSILKILKKYGIEGPKPGKWFYLLSWLGSLNEIREKNGSDALFELGKAIPANGLFHPEYDNIEKALESINITYNINHRFGEIGFYKIVNYNDASKLIVMHCCTPYPCDFDRGLITAVAGKYFRNVKVIPDRSKISKEKESNECTFIVTDSENELIQSRHKHRSRELNLSETTI